MEERKENMNMAEGKEDKDGEGERVEERRKRR
jgi:hypothetical protein